MQLISRCTLWIIVCFALKIKAEIVPVYQIEQSQGPYLQATLTHDVYRYSNSIDLNDLVVLDSGGSKLPHRIEASPANVSEDVKQYPVQFFPVIKGASPESLLALSSASIKLDDNEISVSVEKKDNKMLSELSAPIEFYLIDLSNFSQSVDNLVLQWQKNTQRLYLETEVSGSNDLNSWTPLAQTTLMHLEKEGQSLIRNKVFLNLEKTQYAYLRVKFMHSNEQINLTQVNVENSSKVVKKENSDQWSLSGTLSESQKSFIHSGGAKTITPVAAWEYQRDDIASISQISLQFDGFGYGDNLRIYSRADPKKPWKLVHEGIWFNVQVGSEWQQSDPLNINFNNDIFWRVELHESVRNNVNPILTFHRTPEILRIIANRAGPFAVAIDIGSISDRQNKDAIFTQLTDGKDVDWKNVSLESLNPDLDQFARHRIGVTVSWKTVLFWGVLVLVISLLFSLLIRLVKQMKEQNS
ncbi:MAG TPA: DUF3999 family protein [Cellvibrio sp.]|nr:DUF3999 family protein [Cellvibrio sp.]